MNKYFEIVFLDGKEIEEGIKLGREEINWMGRRVEMSKWELWIKVCMYEDFTVNFVIFYVNCKD